MSRGDLRPANARSLGPEQAFRCAKEIAEELAKIHGKEIVHGDLKGANILLNVDGSAKISGFGSSFKVGDENVRPGTPSELAPEIFAGGYPTKESDIFAFGLILYDLFLAEYMTQNFAGGGDDPLFPNWKEEIFNRWRSPEDSHALSFLHDEQKMGFPFLIEDFQSNPPAFVEEKTMRGLICRCCRLNPQDRPTLDQIQLDLNQLQKKFEELSKADAWKQILGVPDDEEKIVSAYPELNI